MSRPWPAALLVFAATFAALAPALSGGWLDWDDAPLLLERQEWRGFSAANIEWMWTTFHMGPWQPLSWMSYAFDHALYGIEPFGYHLTNLLLHSTSAVLLFLLARELLRGASAPAAFAALFWAIHPMRVESVAWITERRDCLSGLFFIAALLAWTQTRPRLALLCFAASLLSKGMALVLPLALVALDVWPYRRGPFVRLVAEKWAFWLLALAAGIVALVGQGTTGAVVGTEQHGFAARAAQAVYGLVFYVRKTLWPDELMVFYPLPNPLEPGAPAFVLALLVLTAALALLFVFRRRAPAAVTAFAAYALIVAPVLGFVQTGSQLVALRYSYLAALPLALLAGGGLLLLAQRFGRVVLAAGALVLVPLGIATARECRVWHDTVSLWENDLALEPADAPARRNLIVAWVDAARAARGSAERTRCQERALEQCREGLRFGDDAAYHLNAAKIYDMRADDLPAERREWLERALEEARKAVDFVEHSHQRLLEAYEGCGAILCKLERPAEAVPLFEKLVQLDPGSVQRLGMLAEARRAAGDRAGALKSYGALVERLRAQLGATAERDADYQAAMQALRELGAGR